MAPVTGVPKINALIAAGFLVTAALCSTLALMLPWWTGNSTIGQVADKLAMRATASLWSFDLGVAKPDPDDVTQSIIVPQQITWDQMCADKDMTAEEAPIECQMIVAVRGFVFLALIGNAVSAALMVLAVQLQILLLLPAALLAGFTAIMGMMGIMAAMAMSSVGLTGFGVGALFGAILLSFGGAAFGMYSAVNAMREMEPEPPRITRQARAEEARQKEIKQFESLEMGVNTRAESNPSDDGSPKKKKKVMLQKVLDWGKVHDDGEEIPTSLLEAAYREIDVSGDGAIDSTEFCEALQMCGLPVTQTTIDMVMLEIDKNSDGEISIHEFVEFFRNIEELGEFENKQNQQAQFLSVICNCCFLLHVVLFSVLLLSFINMPEGSSDSKLIFQNLLFMVAFVLALLLVIVIIMPAIRLTMGPSLTQWQRAYEIEKIARSKRKKAPKTEDSGAGNLRASGAAWSSDTNVNPVTTRVPVNAAVHGASYRTRRADAQMASQFGAETFNPYGQEETLQRPQDHHPFSPDLTTSSHGFGGDDQAGPADAPVEKYDPNAYRYAAMLAIEARQASSFSPMQVRDLDVAPDNMPSQQPGGMPALTGGY